MAEELALEEVRHKANLYKILSALYYQPTEEMDIFLSHLTESLECLYPGMVPEGQELYKEFQTFAADLTPLQVEHAKLFVGPFQVLAAPYSSVYLSPERRVMGDSTMDALAYYRAAGLEFNGDFKEAPDHVAVELEFLYYLMYQYLQTEDPAYLQQYQEFIASHLSRWINYFSNDLRNKADSKFYQNLGKITNEVIYQELKGLPLA